jgi:hypothetical protein
VLHYDISMCICIIAKIGSSSLFFSFLLCPLLMVISTGHITEKTWGTGLSESGLSHLWPCHFYHFTYGTIQIQNIISFIFVRYNTFSLIKLTICLPITNSHCQTNQNCHHEFPPCNWYILIKIIKNSHCQKIFFFIYENFGSTIKKTPHLSYSNTVYHHLTLEQDEKLKTLNCTNDLTKEG